MKYIPLLVGAFLIASFTFQPGTVSDLSVVKNDVDTCGIKSGDIIFQTSNSSQSVAIQMATNSKYSHVGIIFIQDNDTMVLEAIEPVSLTPLDQWIDRGEGDEFVVKRVRDGSISSSHLRKMKTIGKQFIGKHYDIKFSWTDDKLYCSELVYKIYLKGAGISLCNPRPLKAYDLGSPYVQKQLEKRYGTTLPMDELMVSPGDLFNSDKLIKVSGC